MNKEASYQLYGVSFSYYTAKARSYLIQKGLPYQEVASTTKVYRQTLIPKTGVAVIPVVKTPADEYLQDTAVIVDTLEKQHTENPLTPSSAKQQMVSALFEIWADEWLLLPAMHYRWNTDELSYIYGHFGKVLLPWAPMWIGRFAGRLIGNKFRHFVPLLGVTEKTIPAIENWYENFVLKQLNEHFSQYDYLLGDKPCIGDCALMGPLYAHLYLDPAPGKIMRSAAPNVCAWIERMHQKPIDRSNRRWLADDEIPETLSPLLANQFKEFWPLLIQTSKALDRWKTDNSDVQHIPRTIGKHHFEVGGVREKRSILPFQQWKLQRIQALYRAFSDKEQSIVDNFLKDYSAQEFMTSSIPAPVTRKNNRIAFA